MEHPLRTYRRLRDITLEQLAAEAGLSKSHLSEIETGKRPGARTIDILAKKTGLSHADFFPLGGPLADPDISSLPCSVAGQEGTTNDQSETANLGAKNASAHG